MDYLPPFSPPPPSPHTHTLHSSWPEEVGMVRIGPLPLPLPLCLREEEVLHGLVEFGGEAHGQWHHIKLQVLYHRNTSN